MINLGQGIFWGIAIAHTLFYTIKREDIFEWNADPDEKNRKSLALKRKIIQGKEDNDKPPHAWIIERYLHTLLSLLIGWVLFWVLLDRVHIFSKPEFNNLGFTDFVLFLLGWIGINGRLPSIAHAIVDFMKSGMSIG